MKRDFQIMEIKNPYDGLVISLALAITAPTDRHFREALSSVMEMALIASPEEITNAKCDAQKLVAAGFPRTCALRSFLLTTP